MIHKQGEASDHFGMVELGKMVVGITLLCILLHYSISCTFGSCTIVSSFPIDVKSKLRLGCEEVRLIQYCLSGEMI